MSLFTYKCARIHCSHDSYATVCIQLWLLINKYPELLQSWQQSPVNVKTYGFEQLFILLIWFLWSEKMRNQAKEQLLELSSSACSNLIKKLFFLSGEKLQEILRFSGTTVCLSRSAVVPQQRDLAHWDEQRGRCFHHLSNLITTKLVI